MRAPVLTAYWRVTPATNHKPRPPWFSRQAALVSFLSALDRVPGPTRLVYVADGGVPAELVDSVARGDEVVDVQGGSASRSYRALLGVALARTTARERGLVWFGEDDHLYRPEALVALVGAAQALPGADYFSLYTPDNAAWHADHASQPGRRGGSSGCDVGGVRWVRSWASTSTFGLRAPVLRADAALLRLCSRAGGPWDHTTVSVVQGVAPYPWRHLYDDLYLRASRASARRVLGRPVVRAGIDLLAGLRSRIWVAPEPSLATHVELGQLAAGTDWPAVAAQSSRCSTRSSTWGSSSI